MKKLICMGMLMMGMAGAETYVTQSQGYAAIFDWNKTGSTLKGTFQRTFEATTNNGRPTLDVASYSFTGSQSGKNYTFTIGGNTPGAVNLKGKLVGKNLLVNFPDPKGGFIEVTYTPGSTSKYNQILIGMKSKISKAQVTWDKQVQAAQQLENLRQEVAFAEDAVVTALDDAEAYLPVQLGTYFGPDSEAVAGMDQRAKQAKDSIKNMVTKFAETKDCESKRNWKNYVSYNKTMISRVTDWTSDLDQSLPDPGEVKANLQKDIDHVGKLFVSYTKELGRLPKNSYQRQLTDAQYKNRVDKLKNYPAQLSKEIQQYQSYQANLLSDLNAMLADADKSMALPAQCL